MSRAKTTTPELRVVRRGRLSLLLAVLLASSGGKVNAAQAKAPTNEDCQACHGDKDAVRENGKSIAVLPEAFAKSVHGPMGCIDCHADLATFTDFPHAAKLAKVNCATCHEDAPKELQRSVHARVTADSDGPECVSCHGPAHNILPRSDPGSLVSKASMAGTCATCHTNPDFLARHKIPFARPVEAYRLSVHGRAVARGNQEAASCADCHGGHLVLPSRSEAGKTNHWRVPETCATCHKEVALVYADSVHGQAVKAGVRGAPVCTDCHGEHGLLAPSEPNSLVNPARVSSVTCGRCHGDERLAERFNLPKDMVPAYEDSYHGLALRSGRQTVANCASCHGVHNILASTDPRSTIHADNLAKTCGTCHPGAGERFAIGQVHVAAGAPAEHPVVRWSRTFYLIVIPLTFLGMLLHHLIDFLAKLRRGPALGRSGEEVMRMSLHFRVAHGLVIVSFPTLVITGFALTYPESWWAAPLLALENGFNFRGGVHRAAAVVLLLATLYHLIHLIRVPPDRVFLRQMWPRLKDATDLIGMIRYNLGRSPRRPTFSMFNYAEKAEYWAFMWGTVVMAVTGFVLWFNNLSLAYLPKWVSDAATTIHFWEAVLATGSILIWHFYMVIFDPDVYPMERAWLTGKVSADHLRHTRPSYFQKLAGDSPSAESLFGESVEPNPPKDPKQSA
jgi:cytochrome b subunit of formate dehydrogenase